MVKKRSSCRNLDRIVVEVLPSFLNYNIIIFPQAERRFFPGYRIDTTFSTNIGTIIPHVTAAPYGTKVGDPDAGRYICGGLGQWYRHNAVSTGDKLEIKQVERHQLYKLRVKSRNIRI